MHKQTINYQDKIIKELKDFPEDLYQEVFDFINFLKLKIQPSQNKKKFIRKIKFKTYNLGKMKEFNRGDIYENHLSNRL